MQAVCGDTPAGQGHLYGVGIGGPDLVGLGRARYRHQFISGGDNYGFGHTGDFQLGQPYRSRNANLGRRQHGTGGYNKIACLTVGALPVRILVCFDFSVRHDLRLPFFNVKVFIADDRVCVFWQDRASHHFQATTCIH